MGRLGFGKAELECLGAAHVDVDARHLRAAALTRTSPGRSSLSSWASLHTVWAASKGRSNNQGPKLRTSQSFACSACTGLASAAEGGSVPLSLSLCLSLLSLPQTRHPAVPSWKITLDLSSQLPGQVGGEHSHESTNGQAPASPPRK